MGSQKVKVNLNRTVNETDMIEGRKRKKGKVRAIEIKKEMVMVEVNQAIKNLHRAIKETDVEDMEEVKTANLNQVIEVNQVRVQIMAIKEEEDTVEKVADITEIKIKEKEDMVEIEVDTIKSQIAAVHIKDRLIMVNQAVN